MEMGKLIDQARGEVVLSAISSSTMPKRGALLAPQHLDPTSGEAEVESSPFGVLLGVHPGTSLYQLARLPRHLMAGNIVMVKHAGLRSAMRDRL